MIYAIWNNKGGVGKSFLSFTLATEWAKQHPDARVLVVDMCPQANVSEILLGGNGHGHTHLLELIDSQQTIGGYFAERINSPHKETGKEEEFSILVNPLNRNIPSNLYLVAGDPALELQVQTINNIAVQELPPESWKNVHLWVKNLIAGIIEKKFENRETLCIIDCNPSFASYTEQALLAAERLIIPCSPDGSSARAITNLARLVYGINTPEMYSDVGFHSKSKAFDVAVPKLHMALLNRSTTYSKNPSKAFQAMADQIGHNIQKFIGELGNDLHTSTGSTIQHMPDAHSASVVATSLGMPFYTLRAQSYSLRDEENVTLNHAQLTPYKEKLAEIVNLL